MSSAKWQQFCLSLNVLTQWGWVTHIGIGNLTIIGQDNGLSPDRHQAIIWNNAGILLIGPLKTNFSEIFVKIQAFSFKKRHLKMSSGKWWPFCLGLNVLRAPDTHLHAYIDVLLNSKILSSCQNWLRCETVIKLSYLFKLVVHFCKKSTKPLSIYQQTNM